MSADFARHHPSVYRVSGIEFLRMKLRIILVDHVFMFVFLQLSCTSALCHGLPYPMCNNTTCVYWYSYGDGSLTTGDFVYDTITMDGINGQKQQVNSQTFSQNLSQSPVSIWKKQTLTKTSRARGYEFRADLDGMTSHHHGISVRIHLLGCS